MKNTRMKSYASRSSKLKLKGLGLFEKLSLRMAGSADGKRGLPREDMSGNWTSPYLNREVHAYDEFASKLWKDFQRRQEGNFVQLRDLANSLAVAQKLLPLAREDLAKVADCEAQKEPARMYGESRLTNEQVSARRARESAKRLVPLSDRVDALQTQIASNQERAAGIRSQILEDGYLTKMVCGAVRDHLYQRMDLYWNAAMRKHPDDGKMPVTPALKVSTFVEDAYMDLHKSLLQGADKCSDEAQREEDAA